MFTIFKDFFYRQFPEQHQAEDPLKNGQGEGIWQRYLRTFGIELDENIKPFIDNFIDIIDLSLTDDKYLPLVGNILGDPPTTGDNSIYRKILAYATAIYKVKGTEQAYRILFNLLGMEIDEFIYEVPKQKITYDMPGVRYDEDPIFTYDTECQMCSTFTIKYTSISGDPISPETLEEIENLVGFIQPINATLIAIEEA